jgi:sulfur carrier protein
MRIKLNGSSLQTQAATLHALLQERGLDLEAAFACAVNQRFIAQPQWSSQCLQEDDEVEVVTPVTGG